MKVLSYASPSKCFRFAYPSEWQLKDEDGSVSLWRSEDGGAITISSARHQDPKHQANALEHCNRFAATPGNLRVVAEGDAQVATATFEDAEGIQWYVRVLTAGRYGVIASYNFPKEVQREDREQASKILDSIVIVGS